MQDVGAKVDLAGNLAKVRERIEAAAESAGRNPDEVKLVAVSKTHPPETLREAISTGAGILGENKIQEGIRKIEEIGQDSAEWHLIGHLQSNKARKAVQFFDVIQTLDSLKLARRLERICGEEERESLSVLVQVDLAGEATKSGVKKEALPELIEFLQTCECLKFDGLMIIPPFFSGCRKGTPFLCQTPKFARRTFRTKCFFK